jgi:hypothetical protein
VQTNARQLAPRTLEKLKTDNIVDLDDDKKAAMVSNLMVVLCGEKAASPVLNTGSLY